MNVNHLLFDAILFDFLRFEIEHSILLTFYYCTYFRSCYFLNVKIVKKYKFIKQTEKFEFFFCTILHLN